MIQTILLLTPVYVTLFWAIVLNLEKSNHTPQLFLGKFMLVTTCLYFSHFFYFTQQENIYVWFDSIYQYTSLMVYPLFYIYVRLLTVDKQFSFRLHSKYLIPSTLLFLLYIAGVIFTPTTVYKNYLFASDNLQTSAITYLQIIKTLMQIVFLIQVIVSIICSFRLIRKYEFLAKQYYSDIEDSLMNKMNTLSITMFLLGCSSVILGILGRNFFTNEILWLSIASVIFSTSLFIIGYLGYKQNLINPTYETLDNIQNELSNTKKDKEIEEKLSYILNEKKIFLNSKLTIRDVALAIGTNRTYLSAYINHNYNQNFCSFINDYRLNYLEKLILEQPHLANNILSESCGFGSVDSIKRAVYAKTGLSLATWKKTYCARSGKK